MTARLSLALDRGVVGLPNGPLVVLGATIESDLSVLPKDRTTVLMRFENARQTLEDRGWHCAAEVAPPVEGAVLLLPRAREAQRSTLKHAASLAGAGMVIVDGAKTDGVDAFYRELRDRADVSAPFSKAHGKVFTVTNGDFADWPDSAPALGADGWWRAPGAFSADGVDRASEMLATSLPSELSGRVVDLGAGWGYLSRAVLDREAVTACDLIENDALALDAAQLNVNDGRAAFHWADALSWRAAAPADHVVTNPPFHHGRAADPTLGQAFIRAAAALLKPKGSLWLVANRHLPYETTLKDDFRTLELHAETPSFKVFHATSPTRRKG